MSNLSTTAIEQDGTLSKPLIRSDAEAFNDYAQTLWDSENFSDFVDTLVAFGRNRYLAGALDTLNKISEDVINEAINEHGKSN